MIVLFAAHQGEEFVLALPAIMLVGAFFILRWVNQGQNEDKSDEDSDEVGSEADSVDDGEAVQSRR